MLRTTPGKTSQDADGTHSVWSTVTGALNNHRLVPTGKEMSGINEIQSRIQDIQARVSSPPMAGRFSAVFDAQMAAANARTAAVEPTVATPAEGFVVTPLSLESTASNYGAETVSLGVMLGLTGQTTSMSVSGTIASRADLAQYLSVSGVPARNGHLDPSELSPVSGAWNGTGYLLPPAASAWEQMRAAAAADGIDLRAVDLYRSWDVQESAYRAYQSGAKDEYVLAPGSSQHGIGLAVDVTNGSIIEVGDREHAWLRDNASRFGWYPISNESWHWEFRGV
jgi:zinc D-Ala-D-Ala carboxypeptidase